MHLIMYTHTHKHLSMLIYTCISEMNDNYNRRDKREELGLLCYFKVLKVPKNQYSVIWKWTWSICIEFSKVFQALGKPLKNWKWKNNTTDILKMERKENHIKCSTKNTKGRKRVDEKDRNEEQGQQIENSNKYDSH